MTIPRALRAPVRTRDDRILRSLFGDLTIYLDEFTEAQLAAVIAWYEGVCPSGRMTKYTLEDIPDWDDVSHSSMLTREGRAARGRGERLPFLATVRRRLAENRRFWVQLWDGQLVDHWSLELRAPHYKDLGLRPFLRLMVPVDEVERLPDFAAELADIVTFHSGHGGFAFGYNPGWVGSAFNSIYARARRFWGVDVEHLNGTIRAINPGIKGISWLTLLGPDLVTEKLLADLEADSARTIARRGGGAIVQLGDVPDVVDQNRPGPAHAPYFALAALLEPLFVPQHDEFPGSFKDQGLTMAWIRRFIEPDAWR